MWFKNVTTAHHSTPALTHGLADYSPGVIWLPTYCTFPFMLLPYYFVHSVGKFSLIIYHEPGTQKKNKIFHFLSPLQCIIWQGSCDKVPAAHSFRHALWNWSIGEKIVLIESLINKEANIMSQICPSKWRLYRSMGRNARHGKSRES